MSRTAARVSANSSADTPCRHCGAPLIDEAMRKSGFCCSGCAYVYRLIHEHGLDGYYGLKDELTTPVDTAVFQPRDFEWLAELQSEAEQTASTRPPVLRLDIQGISCAGCVWLIERLFQQQTGARDIVVNAQLGQMEIRWIPGDFSCEEFAQKLHAFNYLVGPVGAEDPPLESRSLVRRIGLSAAFTMNVMLFTFPTYFGMEQTFVYARLFGTLSLVFGTLSLLTGGGYFLQRAWQGLRLGVLHIDLPISLGIVGAYLGSLYGWFSGHERYVYFDFVSGFILLMLIGRWAQVAAVERNRRRLLSQQPRPQNLSIVQPDGTLKSASPETLIAEQIFQIRSGQIVPVEAQLFDSAATFSLASINGESTPRDLHPGQRVPAGAIHLGRQDIRLQAKQVWEESLLAELTRQTADTQEQHPFLDRIIRGYLIGILVIAAAAGIGWALATGDMLRTGAIVTSILVVSCPCAIGLAFPLAEELASIALRRRGVFVRSPDLWSKLSRVRQLIFDKTGTLTLETPTLENPESLANLDHSARAALYALVQGNPHPVSQCLLENLLARGSTPTSLTCTVEESVGDGVFLGDWSLGRAGWKSPASLETATVLALKGETVATFTFKDSVHRDAVSEISKLTDQGLDIHILSGDHAHKVDTIARELGIPSDHGHGNMPPREKADWIKQHDHHDTLMLGDGANDSLAFDAAYCRGTPVIHRGILEQKSDFYYLGRGIGGIRSLFTINAIRRRTQITILIFSVLYNLCAVGLAVGGLMNPLIAAILMPANSLLTLMIVSSSMRGAFRHPGIKEPLSGQERG